MPHQCTSCGRTFPDGSKEMLSGCPDCGGNKFQFKPAGAADGDPAVASDDSTAAADSHAPDSDDSAPVGDPTASAEAGTVSGEDGTGSGEPGTGSAEAGTASGEDAANTDGAEQLRDRSEEDTAQANARSDVVSPDELDRASRDTDPAESPDNDEAHSGVDALREELNDQFESIRIVSPGTYELNLMELYDRQEFIISLQEDGRYVIEMPDAWDAPDE